MASIALPITPTRVTHFIREIVECFSTTPFEAHLDATSSFPEIFVLRHLNKDVASIVEQAIQASDQGPKWKKVYHRILSSP